jgi:glucosyl-3-phosphoglycerate synthase
MPFESPAHWQQARSFHHSRYDEAFLAARQRSVSVCLPARDCAATIGPIVELLVGLRERGAIDQLVVIDGGSSDATATIAADAGASVFAEAALMADYGPVAGKGDAMWRSLSVLEGELICFLDADVLDFPAHYPIGLLGPLIEFDEIEFVKAYYRRPFRQGALVVADGGGRVNHLLARPALAIFYPALAGVRQPLATASRSRCCSTCSRNSGWRAWRRSTSTATKTVTSRCSSWSRWPTPCSGSSRRAWSARDG